MVLRCWWCWCSPVEVPAARSSPQPPSHPRLPHQETLIPNSRSPPLPLPCLLVRATSQPWAQTEHQSNSFCTWERGSYLRTGEAGISGCERGVHPWLHPRPQDVVGAGRRGWASCWDGEGGDDVMWWPVSEQWGPEGRAIGWNGERIGDRGQSGNREAEHANTNQFCGYINISIL